MATNMSDLTNKFDALQSKYYFPGEKSNLKFDDHGWFHEGSRELLSSVISPKTRHIIELGSWLGKSTRWIARNAPNAKIIAIDTWEGSLEHKDNKEYRKKLSRLYEQFLYNCWDYKDQIIPIRKTSARALLEIAGDKRLCESVELVYVDGSHEYEDVIVDLELIYNLFPCAEIIGDDWDWVNKLNNNRLTVREAVLFFCKKYNLGYVTSKQLTTSWKLVRPNRAVWINQTTRKIAQLLFK